MDESSLSKRTSMAEWYAPDHVKQGKRDYAVSGRSSTKVRFIKTKGAARRNNLRGGFGKMRLTRIN